MDYLYVFLQVGLANYYSIAHPEAALIQYYLQNGIYQSMAYAQTLHHYMSADLILGTPLH